MSAEVEPVPPWVWLALIGTAIGSLAGVGLWFARSPRYDWFLRRTGAPREIQVLAAIQRYTESRGNPKAGLGRPELFPSWAQPSNASRDKQLAEANAAAQAYDRNREAYEESPYPERMWVFGSGGAYGLIPANALAPFRGTDALRRGRVTPYDVFHPWRSTVLFVDYVWRVMQRKEYRELAPEHRTVLALKRGLAQPSLAWDFSEQHARSRSVRRRALGAVEALGISERFLDLKVPLEWPNYPGAKELLG